MKYAIVIPDGCADEPQDSLGGMTPLQAANIPAMDRVAAEGTVALAHHVPPSLPPGSDVANLSLFGYDPLVYYTGRAPLEAVALGIELGQSDWAVRCNLVTIDDQIMKSFTAGQIGNDEARELLSAAQAAVGDTRLEFIPSVGYRNLVIFHAADAQAPFSSDTRTTPPHDLTDCPVLDDYPRGPGSGLLARVMSESVAVFARHPVNLRRREAGALPATNVWLWGLGKRPALPSFQEAYGCTGAMITAVDLLRGLATLIGWRCVHVKGATGYLDTDYAAKGQAAVDALAASDLVCVHVEATDEASHEGDCQGKIDALERIDEHIVAPLHAALERHGEYRILVTPDHPTSLRTKTHTHDPVPLAMAGTGIDPDTHVFYNEQEAAGSGVAFNPGYHLMAKFLAGAAARGAT